MHIPAILSNYNDITAYICRRFIPTTAFLVLDTFVISPRNHLRFMVGSFNCISMSLYDIVLKRITSLVAFC